MKEGRKERNGWYDEECQIKVEERNKALNKTLNTRMKMNTENYKNKRRKAKKICRTKKKNERMTLRCWKEWRKQTKEMKQENSVQNNEGRLPAKNVCL